MKSWQMPNFSGQDRRDTFGIGAQIGDADVSGGGAKRSRVEPSDLSRLGVGKLAADRPTSRK